MKYGKSIVAPVRKPGNPDLMPFAAWWHLRTYKEDASKKKIGLDKNLWPDIFDQIESDFDPEDLQNISKTLQNEASRGWKLLGEKMGDIDPKDIGKTLDKVRDYLQNEVALEWADYSTKSLKIADEIDR
ncbi:MAG: hypothetical protein JRJ85_04550, partial [Deltaproteobacteria bacterium]|nr:hypothetical protein [Deltaproteobacteria bacterium]